MTRQYPSRLFRLHNCFYNTAKRDLCENDNSPGSPSAPPRVYDGRRPRDSWCRYLPDYMVVLFVQFLRVLGLVCHQPVHELPVLVLQRKPTARQPGEHNTIRSANIHRGARAHHPSPSPTPTITPTTTQCASCVTTTTGPDTAETTATGSAQILLILMCNIL